MLNSDIAAPFSASPSRRLCWHFLALLAFPRGRWVEPVRPALHVPCPPCVRPPQKQLALFCPLLTGLLVSAAKFQSWLQALRHFCGAETVALWPCSRRLTVVGRTQVPTLMRLFVDFPFMSYVFGVISSASSQVLRFPFSFHLKRF